MTLEGLKPRGPTACTTCAKAKSRCIPGPPDSGKCERCHRLEKPCASQTPARPRPKKEPRPTKVAELEKRLAELTSQLHVAQAQGSTSASASASAPCSAPVVDHAINPPRPVTRRDPAGTSGRWFNHIFPEVSERDPASPDDGGSSTSEEAGETSPSPGSFNSGSRDSSGGSNRPPRHPVRPEDVEWPSGSEAEQLLQMFRDVMVPLYPFVIPPPDLTASQLAAQHPFLFKGIVVATYYVDAFRQIVLGDRLLTEISQAAITRPQNSLDVLQSLQLLIPWFTYNMSSFQLTNLLFLARSMCIGLGYREGPVPPGSKLPSSAVTLDHMRAFTGCYYLNSLICNTNKTPNAFTITPYLEKCCATIEERAEYRSDQFLVHLFRIQQLAQSISLSLGQQHRIGATLQSMQLPLTVVLQSFQEQIDMFKSSLPDGLKTNPILLSHISVAEMLLYEVGIPESQNPNSVLRQHEKLELLWRCLGGARRFLSIRFGGPLYTPPRFTMLGASDWLYVILVCLRLLALQVPGWDLVAVSKQISLDEMADREVEETTRCAERRRQGRSASELVAAPASKYPGYFDPLDRVAQVISHLKVIVASELDAYIARFSSATGYQQLQQDPQWQQQQLPRQPQHQQQQEEQQEQGQEPMALVLAMDMDNGTQVSASGGSDAFSALATPGVGMGTFSDPYAPLWDEALYDPSWTSFMENMNAMTDLDWNY